MASHEPVAVLGAGGTMGSAIARNLARAGFGVRAWNRTREKAEPLTADGALIFDSPAEAAEGAVVVLTMLADASAVIAAMEGEQGALASAGESTVWLQMSTIGDAGTERCIELAGRRGVAFVDAPVLGTKQPAEQGELVVLASGHDGLRDRVKPIFDVIGQRTLWVGDAGMGSRLKLVTNSWLVAVVEGGAETIALAEGLGLDPRLLLEAIKGGGLDMPYLRLKANAILERNFEPSFRLALAAKDAALADDAADRHHLDLPALSAIRRRLEQGAQAHGDQDVSATYLTSVPSEVPA